MHPESQLLPLPDRLLRFIAFFVRRHLVSFLALTTMALMWSVEQVLFPYTVKMFVDIFTHYEGDSADIYAALSPALWLGGSVWVASMVAWRISDWADYHFSPGIQADIRERMLEYVFQHSHRYFTEHLAGSIANKIADMVRGVHYILGNAVRFFFPILITIVLSAGFMASIHWVFVVIVAGWALTHIGICLAYAKSLERASRVHSEFRSELQGRVVDSITNFGTVRLFARRREELGYIHEHQQREVDAAHDVLFLIAKVKFFLEVPCFLMMIVMIRTLISGWQEGWVSAGDVTFILSATLNLIYLLWRAGMEFPAFYREFGVCAQALTLIQQPHDVIDAPNAAPLAVSRGEIRFEGVDFSYHKGQHLFTGKHVLIRGGEKVGLVGFSGSGKSSFVNLILRLYDLQGGRILIDGQDIAAVTQDSLRAQIALIPQDPVLFHRSLRENLAYGLENASEEAIIAAAKQAHCHEFILQAEHGYDSIVGERGVKLSGGQRQRIAIGRALLKNAPILIFDEATSSLDSVTEAAIQDSMQQMMEGRTTIVIAHRLSTLTRMDRLLVFRGGAIIEDGTHQALLAKGGHYAELWHMQVGGFLPDRDQEAPIENY